MNVSPHINVLITLICAVAMVALFYFLGLEQQYFLVPLLVLALLNMAVLLKRQYDGKSIFRLQKNIHWPTLLKRALARYLVWLTIIALAGLLYQQLPYYNGEKFAASRLFFDTLLWLHIYLGLPYFIVTLLVKSSQTEDFYDPAIRLIHIVKQIGKQLFAENSENNSQSSENPFKVLKNPANRKVLLNLLMRAYFVPIMIIQVMAYLFACINLLKNANADQQLISIIFLVGGIFWLMDIINAGLNYALESRWLENRSRSVDMTAGGWLVCLACYEPLNFLTGSLFPFAPVAAASPGTTDLVYSGALMFTIIKCLELAVLMTHVYANVSLGPSIVNISLKKLQTRGLYSLVRHPGTTTKLFLWLLQSAFYKRFWTLKILYGYTLWGFIYVMRAYTEERHLSKYPEYIEYMKKVKKRFLPGLF